MVSDSTLVTVHHTLGGIVTTPDGKAVLSVSQTSLKADTAFSISPYTLPQGSPKLNIDSMYQFEPVDVTTLNPGQGLIVEIWYNPALIPSGVQEQDLRLALFNPVGQCWTKVYLDSPSVTPGNALHEVTTRDSSPGGLTVLGIFGVTTVSTPTCPNPPTLF